MSKSIIIRSSGISYLKDLGVFIDHVYKDFFLNDVFLVLKALLLENLYNLGIKFTRVIKTIKILKHFEQLIHKDESIHCHILYLIGYFQTLYCSSLRATQKGQQHLLQANLIVYLLDG